MSFAYLRLLIFLPTILIPACALSSLAFHMMYSACKLNKQGDNIHPCGTPFYLEPVCCSMSGSNCCFLTCIQVSQETCQVKERKKESEVAQSCLSLCNPVDCSPPGASVHGIFQARILEWVAISFSRRSSRDRSGGLLFPSVEEFSTVCCDLHKGFSVVGEAEVDVFLEFPCFFDDPLHVGNLKYGFSKFR